MKKYTHIVFDVDSIVIDANYLSDVLFEGIEHLFLTLHINKIHTAITSFKKSTRIPRFEFGVSYENMTCANDPILKYKEYTKAKNEEILYIGNSKAHKDYADSFGIDFGLALWNCDSVKHIYATHYFGKPSDIIYMLQKKEDPLKEMHWLRWAMELQFISQAGITYSNDKFDKERFERLREISAEIMNLKTSVSIEKINTIFCNETGFQTPKLDTRAAIFKDNNILLVEENNGTWSLPGGWVDVNESIKSNTIKEVKEEAGLDVLPTRLIAVQDRNLHNIPVYAYGVCKVFVLCEIIGGSFTDNIETLSSRYFSLDEIPRLAEEKNSKEQIRLCFEAYHSKNWQVVFD